MVKRNKQNGDGFFSKLLKIGVPLAAAAGAHYYLANKTADHVAKALHLKSGKGYQDGREIGAIYISDGFYGKQKRYSTENLDVYGNQYAGVGGYGSGAVYKSSHQNDGVKF